MGYLDNSPPRIVVWVEIPTEKIESIKSEGGSWTRYAREMLVKAAESKITEVEGATEQDALGCLWEWEMNESGMPDIPT